MRGGCINILIGGEAGQGLATINDILCKTLVRHGYSIGVVQDYMSRVRGGHNAFYIRVGVGAVIAPEETVDLLLALNMETVVLHRAEMAERSLIVSDEQLGIEDDNCMQVPFKELAEKKFHNVTSLGVLGSLLGLDEGILQETVRGYFENKSEDILTKNEENLKKAVEWASTKAQYSFLELKKPDRARKRLTMNGNQGVALGALSAGIKFYSFYPMSPSTLLGVTLAGHMDKLPLVVEQAEDEIAAINMAIGASVAGAPAMVGTSGGGFALMTEAVSFAAVSETPLVVLVAQRPGPATGLPTRTEQADLELVLHGGHGEFPKAILAPGTVEQCFYLTRKAFELAETTQSQVFVLTDQYLSDCYQAVHEFDIENLKPIEVGGDAGQVASPYQRYELTSSGVSPRLIPGKNKHLVVTDSHEHTEDGHITEEAKCRVRMVKKRLRKMKLIERETIQPEFVGDKDADLVLLCWGSTRDSAIEAAAMLNERGTRAAALHFSQVWPLVPEHFMKYLEAAREVVSVESNAFGQFARLLRRETGFAVARTVLKYDGRVITPEYILRELGEE